MKNEAIPTVFNLNILVLAILFAAVVYIGATGKKVPLLSNIKADIVLLVVLGIAICSQGGIGRVAALGTWTHPQAIIGYVLGGLILLVAVAAFAGWQLPMVQNGQQALVVISILAALKVVNAFIHHYLFTKPI